MKRWSYTLLTIAMLVGALLIRHSPAAAQQGEGEFVPTEKLPADAMISFPVDI